MDNSVIAVIEFHLITFGIGKQRIGHAGKLLIVFKAGQLNPPEAAVFGQDLATLGNGDFAFSGGDEKRSAVF